MDEYNMNALSNMLFAELLVGIIFRLSSSALATLDIKNMPLCNKYSEEYLNQIVKDLIAYGLVVPHICGTTHFTFSITDFGKYYYDRLAQENSDISALLIWMRGELK